MAGQQLEAPVPPEFAGLEHLPLPAVVFRRSRVAYANPAHQRMTGIESRSLLGMSVQELIERFVPPEDLTGVRELAAAQAGSPKIEGDSWLTVRKACGGALRIRVKSVRTSRPDELVQLYLDAEADAAAQRLGEALTTVAATLTDLRTEGDVLTAAADALHWQRLEVLLFRLQGETLVPAVLRVTAPEDVPAVLRPHADGRAVGLRLKDVAVAQSAFAERRAVFETDAMVNARPGFPAEALAYLKRLAPHGVDAPIYVEGEPFGLLCVRSADLTPAGAAAVDLFASFLGSALANVAHHRWAAQALKELKALQGELLANARLAALGEAAAVVAHEVRNPLAAILNATALLKNESCLDPEVRAAALQALADEGKRLEQLVRDLLDAARPMNASLGTVDVRRLLTRIAALFQERREAAAGRISLQLSSAQLCAEADESLLSLALENLVRNALQASPEGAPVRVTARPYGNCVQVWVEDAGPGIPGSLRERIFEPFFTTKASGTGLGLPIVKRAVEAMGAKLEVSPGDLGGARFQITLRASEPASQVA